MSVKFWPSAGQIPGLESQNFLVSLKKSMESYMCDGGVEVGNLLKAEVISVSNRGIWICSMPGPFPSRLTRRSPGSDKQVAAAKTCL